MPKIQRHGIPRALLEHLLDRVRGREISLADLELFLHWIDRNPEVPLGDWFKRFPTFLVCGDGPLVLTFLKAHMSALGTEID